MQFRNTFVTDKACFYSGTIIRTYENCQKNCRLSDFCALKMFLPAGKVLQYAANQTINPIRWLQTTAVNLKVQAGRYRVTTKKDRPLTYEMANPPHRIAHRKSWNSWNTSNLLDGIRPSQTAIEDVFIRKFMTGTWHNLISSEIIIKRQHNHIRISAIVRQALTARKMYFLIGYCEELLASWLQCPITLELQTIADKKDVVFKYI